MFELEQYKATRGESFASISRQPPSPKQASTKPTNIFAPTAVPEQQPTAQRNQELTSNGDLSMSAVDLNLTGIKTTAAAHGTEMAKLQIQYNLLLKENNDLREKQEVLIEETRLSKVLLETERKANRELKSEKSNFYSRRNQLEELFLNCVEETRKDINRRRAGTLAQNANLNKSLHKGVGKKHDDSLESAIKNEHFTASDKRKVLELLLSNENVLLFLYEKLFPRAITTSTLLNHAHLTGATQNNYTNIGYRPKTSSSMQRMPARLNTKSQRVLQQSVAGNPIKFRHMSTSSMSKDGTTIPMTAATRTNSNFNLGGRPSRT